MPPLKRFAAAALGLAVLGLLAPATSFAAQQVLLLSTAEVVQADKNAGRIDCTDPKVGAPAITHAKDKLQGALGTDGTLLNYSGTLSTPEVLKKLKGDNGNDGWTEAKKTYPNWNLWDEAKAILEDTDPNIRLTDGDVVFIMAPYGIAAPEKLDVIAAQINARKGLTFVILFDTGSDAGYDFERCEQHSNPAFNMSYITDKIANQTLGWNLAPVSLHNSVLRVDKDGWGRSAYADAINLEIDISDDSVPPNRTETRRNMMFGQHTGSIQCSPQQNVIFAVPTPPHSTGYNAAFEVETNTGYFCDGSRLHLSYADSCPLSVSSYGSWPELNASSAYGLLIPPWQSNNGQGACVYLGTDDNIFDEDRRYTAVITVNNKQSKDIRAYQQEGIVQMFLTLNAACTDEKPAGICDDLKDGEKCMLADVVDASAVQPENLAVLPTLKSDAATLQCAAKVWCEESKVAQNAGGNLCCGKDAEGNMLKPTGTPGNQICCADGQENVGGVCTVTGKDSISVTANNGNPLSPDNKMTPGKENPVDFTATNPDGSPLTGKVTIKITDPGKGTFPGGATEITVDVVDGKGSFPLIPSKPGEGVPVTLTIDGTDTSTSATIPVKKDGIGVSTVNGKEQSPDNMMTPNKENTVGFVLCADGSSDPDCEKLPGTSTVAIEIIDPSKGAFPEGVCESKTKCTVTVTDGVGNFPLIPSQPGQGVPVTLTIDGTDTSTSATIPVAPATPEKFTLTRVNGKSCTAKSTSGCPLTPKQRNEVTYTLTDEGGNPVTGTRQVRVKLPPGVTFDDGTTEKVVTFTDGVGNFTIIPPNADPVPVQLKDETPGVYGAEGGDTLVATSGTAGSAAPVPVNNPWALALLGAAVAAAARRRQRK